MDNKRGSCIMLTANCKHCGNEIIVSYNNGDNFQYLIMMDKTKVKCDICGTMNMYKAQVVPDFADN